MLDSELQDQIFASIGKSLAQLGRQAVEASVLRGLDAFVVFVPLTRVLASGPLPLA